MKVARTSYVCCSEIWRQHCSEDIKSLSSTRGYQSVL